MLVKIDAFIHYDKYSWERTGTFSVSSYESKQDENRTFVCKTEIEVEVPDNYDPTPQKIAALEQQKIEARAVFDRKVREINTRISELQAIEFTPSTKE